MADIKIKRGFGVRMTGAPEPVVEDAPRPKTVSIRPDEFRLIKPKIEVKEGDTVSIGSPLFHDRSRPELRFPSPGSGTISEIRRGPRRVCEEIFVDLGADDTWVEHDRFSPDDARGLERDRIVQGLVESGLWTLIRSRPFSLIPEVDSVPEGIFISASDSSPLPFQPSLALDGREDDFQLGIDLLGKLTGGKVHLCMSQGAASSRAFDDAEGCEKHRFRGPYPSGQIEVQIHYLMPYKKGRLAWFVDAQDVAAIGELFRTGRYSVDRVVAIGGEMAARRGHFRTRRGVSADHLLGGEISPARTRCVSGNVLAGRQIRSTSGLGHYDSKICLVPEGDEPEFIGWMKPGFGVVSRWRAYAGAVAPVKEPHLTTNLGGGVRAHVATGVYDDVCAVDIFPAYLMKSILANDLEEMEGLGLQDCAECGLCTFVCPSKIEFGEIIAGGIEDFLTEEEG
jgi:Na+-transporting NADH:ubiquinone oxidoreductase subunit A